MANAAQELLAKLDSRPVNWRKEMLALYDQGASDREIMREFSITPDQWQILVKDPMTSDFLEVVFLGRLLCHAWWEAEGRKNLYNPKFQVALYKFQMNNRFGWSEKTEQSLTNLDYANMDDQGLVNEIRDLYAKLEAGRSKTTV